MPTWQAMEFLEPVLDALAGQRIEIPWDLHVIDSGSTDGTWEHLRDRRAGFPVPFRIERIPQAEFDHGDTRNQLAARSAGDLLVFLTQDAVPSHHDWLATLARNFEDPAVGGAYSRNVPRPGARLLTRVFCRSDPGYSPTRAEVRLPDAETWSEMSAEERRLFHNFNDVASAVRRELWERHPFPRTTMGEDVLMGRGLIEAGYTVVYDARATVDHSHEYGPEKMRWRGNVDGKFNAEWMDRISIASEADLGALLERLVAQDARVLEELGVVGEELERLCAEARDLRGASLRGLYEGGLSPRRYPRTAMRPRSDVHALFVAEGPLSARDSALETVKELHRRGHHATVLALSPSAADGGLHLLREDHDGVTVVHANAPRHPDALGAAFRNLLLQERVELVHFHTLRGAASDLIGAARALQLATVASLQDDRALRDRDSAEIDAARLADLRLCSDETLRDAWLAGGGFDPETLAFCPHGVLGCGGDRIPGAEAIAEEAAELEFRYRALCCITDGPRMLEATGADARTGGETELQGATWLLMRPGSSAEYTLRNVSPGHARLELEQYVWAPESEVVLAGRARVDGLDVGSLAPLKARGRTAAVRRIIEFDLPRSARVLRLEPGEAGGAHLRICRVLLTSLRVRNTCRSDDARDTRP
jgi:rhamnosyltransferase